MSNTYHRSERARTFQYVPERAGSPSSFVKFESTHQEVQGKQKRILGPNTGNRFPGQGCGSVTASLLIVHKVLGSILAWQDKTREQPPVSLSFCRAERIQFQREQQEEAGGS